jgi:hypothetical protein
MNDIEKTRALAALRRIEENIQKGRTTAVLLVEALNDEQRIIFEGVGSRLELAAMAYEVAEGHRVRALNFVERCTTRVPDSVPE